MCSSGKPSYRFARAKISQYSPPRQIKGLTYCTRAFSLHGARMGRGGGVKGDAYMSGYITHTVNEGPVRIQIQMSGSNLCIPRNVTACGPRLFQNRIIMFCLPISTFMYL
jgi:hypothetical protein